VPIQKATYCHRNLTKKIARGSRSNNLIEAQFGPPVSIAGLGVRGLLTMNTGRLSFHAPFAPSLSTPPGEPPLVLMAARTDTSSAVGARERL
jgi:hypothetical protein